MRVHFVNQYVPPDEAATAQLLGDLAETAARAGWDVFAIGSDRSYARPEIRYARRETWRGVRVVRVPSTGFGRSGLGRLVDYATYLAGAALRLLTLPRADVVVGLSTPPILGFLAVAAARLRGGRGVYWTMDVYPDVAFALGALRPGSAAGRLLGWMSRRTLHSADLVVALGETMEARLAALGARRTVAVHNWADGAAIRPLAPGESALRSARGWQARFVVLYSGNLGLAHEFDTALDAAALLSGREREGDASVLFAFVGGGPRLVEVRAAAERRSLSNVAFLPAVRREELGDGLAAGDLHLVTLRPGLPGLLVPSKLYGALAAGRPTLYVGPAAGEVHDLLTAHGCGVSTRNGDAEGLAAAIRAYADDPARRTREGAAARALFERSFTKERQTAAFLSALAARPA